MEEDSRIDDCIRQMLRHRVPIADIKLILRVGQDRIDKAKASPKGTRVPKKPGRPTKVTPKIRRFIEVETLANGALRDQELADMIAEQENVRISHDTLCRVRRSLGFKFRPRMVVQELSETQKSQRLDFCRWILGSSNVDFSKIVFSDESRFCQEPDNSWVYIRRGEWNDSVMAPKAKFSNGIMCFAAIGVGFKSRLVVCKGAVNSREYIRCLEECGVRQAMDSKHGAFRWFLMQDGAPSHTCQETMKWLRDKINILPGWPPNSPDLNPIEMLWALIKHQLNKTTGPIEERLLEIWDAFRQQTVDRLVMSFRHRTEMVVSRGGESVSQYLSSHIEPPICDPPTERETDECVDAVLFDFVREFGAKWSVVAAQINSRHGKSVTAQYVRQRFKVLSERQLMEKQLRRLPSIHELPLPADSPFVATQIIGM